jgi:hypothetical protein
MALLTNKSVAQVNIVLETLQCMELRCETRQSPLGLDTPHPRMSWVIESTGRGVRQSAYQLLVATRPELLRVGDADLWDSGRVESNQSVLVEYGGRQLAANQRVYWTVRVWDTRGRESTFASPAHWTMGLLTRADWHAQWIGVRQQPASPLHPPLPLLRKRFDLRASVKRATLYVCGLGQYQLYVNGQVATDTVFNQAWSRYEKTIYYDSYDVTRLLSAGPNAMGLMLARGPYTNSGDRRTNGGVYERPLAAIAQLEIEYADESSERVISDESWRWKTGPYTHNSFLGGCDYDARLLPSNWAAANGNDEGWTPVEPRSISPGALIGAISPPLRTFEEFKPKSIDEPKPGHFVYDFGQNASATLRLRIRGKAGQTVRFTYAEQRHGADAHTNNGKGLVNQSGIRSPNYIQYTCAGTGEEEWLCDLFYSGFQYVELTGGVPAGSANPDGLPIVTQLSSVHVHADAESVGALQCANEMYLRIERAIDWAVRSNLSYVLTDCPHREKMGWLEVPYLMWPSIAMKYDLSCFGPKICRDIRDTQRADGMIPTVAPCVLREGFHFGATSNPFMYTPEWGAAGVMLPWYVYEWYGDVRTLRESYPSMRAFVEYVKSTCKHELVPQGGLGDWYDYGHGHPPAESRFTPLDLTAMATFHLCARTMRDAAHVLGKNDDAAKYTAMCDQISSDFNRRFFDLKTGEYENTGSCQTANAMAIVCGLVKKEDRARVADAIVADLKRREYQQTSGDVGFHYLVRALADTGHSDAIFRILNRTNLGSYGYLVNAGWTSLPEAWDAHAQSSMNHCMLGHVQEWFAMDLGAIRNSDADDNVAFQHFVIRPVFSGSVNAASYTFRSPHGQIRSAWRVEGDRFHLDVTVPGNTEADVHLPATAVEAVREGNRIATDSDGVRLRAVQNGEAVFRVGSGSYRFDSPLPQSSRPHSVK